MKNFMSNKEYSKTRKYFKIMYENGDLTKEVCESKEYLNFLKEENKRQKAKAFVKEFLDKFVESAIFTNIRKKIDIYYDIYKKLLKKQEKLEKELEDLFKNKKVDQRKLDNLRRHGEFSKSQINFIGFIHNFKHFKVDNIFLAEKYQIAAEKELLKVREDIILFSNSLIKTEKELKKIKRKEKNLIEKSNNKQLNKEKKSEKNRKNKLVTTIKKWSAEYLFYHRKKQK